MDSQGQAEPELNQNAAKNRTIPSLHELDFDLDVLPNGRWRRCRPRLRTHDQGRDRGGDEPQYDTPWGPFALCTHCEVLSRTVLSRD